MAVRTKILASAVATTTLTTIYTCPADKTAIIKGWTFYNPVGGASSTVFLSRTINGNARGLHLELLMAVNTTAGATDLFFVLEPGDLLRLSANPSSAVQVVVDGAELDGVAP